MNHISGVAGLSVVLYSALAFVSAYFYFKFKALVALRNNDPNHDYGRYDEVKLVFFLVLTISVLLDIPIYIGCLAHGGPDDCEWDDASYPVFWSLHLIALCGYIFTIVTPPVLWSDIVSHKDGKLWFSQYPMDKTKWFFQISLYCFWLLMFMTILLIIIYWRANDHTHFVKQDALNAVSSLGEPILTFIIAAGCFICGIRLQYYVMGVKIGGQKQKRFLVQLNITLLVILATYLSRSLMVLRLFGSMPDAYQKAFGCPYIVWLLVTRWLPYIFCSFCLINEMKYSGAQIAEKYSRTTASNTTAGEGGGMTKSSSFHSLLINPEQMTMQPMHYDSDEYTGGTSGFLTQALLSADSAPQYQFEFASPPEDTYLMQDDVANTYEEAFDLNAYLNVQLTHAAAAEAAIAAKHGHPVSSTAALSVTPPRSETFLSSSVNSNDMFNPDTDF